MRTFTEDALDQALREQVPLLISFTAPWCNGSREMAARLEELEIGAGGRLTVGIVEVEEAPRIPARFGVRGVPTTMIFKEGAIAATRIGALSRRQIADWVSGLV